MIVNWTLAVYAVVSVALIGWIVAGLWVSVRREEAPQPKVTQDALMRFARLLDEEFDAVETWQRTLDTRVHVLEERAHGVTNNRHPTTENDPPVDSASAGKQA